MNIRNATQNDLETIYRIETTCFPANQAAEYYFNYIQNGWPIDAGETINLGRNTTTDSIFIRVVQISGIINTPYDSTFNPIITCGNTTTINFP